MTEARDLASGKGEKDENFPVASLLLRPEQRTPILAFYRFARAADDIADNSRSHGRDEVAICSPTCAPGSMARARPRRLHCARSWLRGGSILFTRTSCSTLSCATLP